MESKVFPNGHHSWMEAFYECVVFITINSNPTAENKDSPIIQAAHLHGTPGLLTLAEE